MSSLTSLSPRAITPGLVFIPLLLGIAAGGQDEQGIGLEYVSNRTCKLCHDKAAYGGQWTVWADSPHPDAYRTLLEQRSIEIANKLGIDKPPSQAPECLRCHATGYDPETHTVAEGLRVVDGVQCESCHGPGSLHVEDGRRYWMEREFSVNTAARIRIPNQRTCVQCHNPQSPTWDSRRFKLPDGRTTAFDFETAFGQIAHPLLKRLKDDLAPESE